LISIGLFGFAFIYAVGQHGMIYVLCVVSAHQHTVIGKYTTENSSNELYALAENHLFIMVLYVNFLSFFFKAFLL